MPGLRLPVLAIALPPMDGFFLQCTGVLPAYFPEKGPNLVYHRFFLMTRVIKMKAQVFAET